VAFHEGFWVVTGTAAPVIALAAVVSLAEAGRTFYLSEDPSVDAIDDVGLGGFPTANAFLALDRSLSLATTAMWIAAFGIVNLLLQTALLAVSLVSLADEVSLVPSWLAVVAAVGGLLLLAVSSLGTVLLRLKSRPPDEDATSSE
jgi:hypothetical protein